MARSGLYVQLDVNFPDDDKIEEAGLDGAGLYAMALCLAKRLMTDGKLKRSKLHRLGATDELIDRLVQVDLFCVRETSADAVWITAWTGHNEPSSAIEERRAKDAARKRATRANRPSGHADTSAQRPRGHADTVEKSREEKSKEENTPSPDPVPALAAVPEPDRSADADGSFVDWWKRYPRKDGKAEAETAYRRALRGARGKKPVPVDVLEERTRRQLALWKRNGTEPQFIPRAATWLNGRRWEDDVLDAPSKPADPYDAIDAGGYR